MRFATFGNVAYDLSLEHEGSSTAVDHLRTEWLRPVSTKLKEIGVSRATAGILEVAKRKSNWDGYGSAAPNSESIGKAVSFFERMIHLVSNAGLSWADPAVGLDENGDVVFEWWNNTKKLTLYIGPNKTNFVVSWGANVENEMVAGLLQPASILGHWRWLRSYNYDI